MTDQDLPKTIRNFIKAFEIFARVAGDDRKYPTGCEHDTLHVYVDPATFSAEDIAELERLGFHADLDNESFYSFAYGSA